MSKYIYAPFVLLFWVAQPVASEPLRIAVASNALAPVKRIAEQFSVKSGTKTIISSGSTGKLYVQIINGAPYDVFLAANSREPISLETSGMILPDSRFTYVVGRLVLYYRAPDNVDLGFNALDPSRIQRLAIANPKTAPYGAAAVDTLKKIGKWPLEGIQVVRGENIGQVLQYALSGNVDAAFLAKSQWFEKKSEMSGRVIEVNKSFHPLLKQQAVILKRTRLRQQAMEFMAYLRSQNAINIFMHEYGYDVP